ncbi:chemotaxis protein CheW [Methylotuvimicrobium buryatense]|uniref:Chemotaxis protein CheW n=1 Tax=Methylotuvimicrobium buryatense TaxID=95641 RepID=A0A4P9UQ54_METBY|nr:chemotaxis protein CheW [Methylotuvimicrobium buryatense]QCW83552.1 chemotaxis protein CheW [Methylotuvimicrobium buryatense]
MTGFYNNNLDVEQQIIHQELALDSYLKTLLEEMPTEESEVIMPSVPEIKASVPKMRVESKIKEKSETVAKMPALVELQLVPKPTMPLAVMPTWAQYEFQALFFRIGQLILATPLVELSRAIKFDKRITKIPGQPSWFIGLLEDQERKIGILDSGQLILGKGYANKRDLIEQPFKSMLITQDGNWGLACDELLSIGKVRPEQVRWRTNRKQRPWLIGTVIEELTAVIDVKQLTPRRKVKR